jgi:cytochrome P450
MNPIPTIPMHEEAYWQNPYPVLREIREEHRVARTDQGHIAILRWEDAVAALKGTDFIAEGIEVLERRGFQPGDPMHTWRKNAIGVMEGDDHRRVRSLAANALSKRKMEGLRPLIRSHAHALLDELTETGEMNALRDYAGPLPRRVMMDFLGISADEFVDSHREMAKVNIVDCFGPNVTADLRSAANKAIQHSMDHVAGLYEKRRAEPRDDLLTHLMQAKDEAGVLSEGEMLTLFSTIFGSGASTTSILASGILELTRHPEQAEVLRQDPARWMKGASEETLRCRPSITAVGQKAARKMKVFDVDFERHEPISVLLGSANRDASYWQDPERFDIRRDPKKTSLTFGIGAHVCLGHAMARATVEESLAAFVERCDEISLRNEPQWTPFVMENKLDALQVGFVARERAA